MPVKGTSTVKLDNGNMDEIQENMQGRIRVTMTGRLWRDRGRGGRQVRTWCYDEVRDQNLRKERLTDDHNTKLQGAQHKATVGVARLERVAAV